MLGAGGGCGEGLLNGPTDVALSADGEMLYISENGNHRSVAVDGRRALTHDRVWDGQRCGSPHSAVVPLRPPALAQRRCSPCIYQLNSWC